MSFSEIKQHQFKHMSRGTHPAYQDATALWDAHNIRLTSREGETKFAIVNEKSTREVYSFFDFFGGDDVYLIGQAVVGDYLVVFLHDSYYTIDDVNYPDHILRFDMTTYDADAQTINDPVILYRGDLGFDPAHPMQCVVDKESELIEKIYWTDGINKPRMINICKPELVEADAYDENLGYTAFYSDAPFDFVQTMTLDEECSVERLTSGSGGNFPAGTIQYALTYYFKYGQETNIFYTSEILYTSYADRGAAADDLSLNCAFRITVKNPESDKFDYLRIYSIKRTSLDGTAVAQQVADINLHDEKSLLKSYDDDGNLEYEYVQFVDTNTTGADVDFNKLLYLGSKDIICGCMCSKDNTLFMGNITYNRKSLVDLEVEDSNVADYYQDQYDNGKGEITCMKRDFLIRDFDSPIDEGSFYTWQSQLNVNTTTFKRGETYRLGLQFQYKTGEWSEPVWIGDYTMEYDQYPEIYYDDTDDDYAWRAKLPEFTKILYSRYVDALLDAGYLRVRPLIVFPAFYERDVVAQGVVSPTVFQSQARRNNAPFSFSSWLFRFMGEDPTGDQVNMGLSGSVAQWWHLSPLTSGRSSGAEIQNMAIAEDYKPNMSEDNKYRVLGDYENWAYVTQGDSTNKLTFDDDLCVNDFDLEHISKMLLGVSYTNSDDKEASTANSVSAYGIWYVDWSVCTLHSPDVEFETSVQNLLSHNENLGVRIIGLVPFTETYGDIDIDLKSVQVNPDAKGFVPAITHNDSNGGAGLISGLFFHDSVLDDSENGDTIGIINSDEDDGEKHYMKMWMTHLWHRAGSLNNDIARQDDGGTRTAELNTKIVANIHYSADTLWFSDKLLDNLDGLDLDVYDIDCFNQEEVQLTKLNDMHSVNGDINYYGNVDFMNASYTPFKLVCTDSNVGKQVTYDDDGNATEGDVDYRTGISYNGELTYQYFENYDGQENDKDIVGDWWRAMVTPTDGVRIKYLSTPHAVFNFEYATTINGYKYAKSMPVLVTGSSTTSSIATVSEDVEEDASDTASANSVFKTITSDLGFSIRVDTSVDTISICSGDLAWWTDGDGNPYVSSSSYYETNANPLIYDSDDGTYKLYNATFNADGVNYSSGGTYQPDGEHDYNSLLGIIWFSEGSGDDYEVKEFRYGLINENDAIEVTDLEVTADDEDNAMQLILTGTLHFPDDNEFADKWTSNVGVPYQRDGDYEDILLKLEGVEVTCTIELTSESDFETLLENNSGLTFTGYVANNEDIKVHLYSFSCATSTTLASFLSLVSDDDEDENDEDSEGSEDSESGDDDDTSVTLRSETVEQDYDVTAGSQYWLFDEYPDDVDDTDMLKITKIYIDQDDTLNAATFGYNNSGGVNPSAYLWLCEIYQKEVTNRFGGDSKEALQNNIWLPAGPSVALDSNTGTTVEWQWGDTWYQRYDCLKTYPFSDEDTNQVVEIGSFMCETHYNLDGRYDRNRALVSNISVNHQNFNLMNDAYCQMNNAFTYQIYDEYWYKTNEYPSQIFWTNTKSAIADVDEYTHIHEASSMDLDGSFGKVTAIAGYKDGLFVLQDKAVLQLAFNDKSIITSESGVPVEIANSEKVSDYTTVHTNVGCQDKFAVTTTPSGIYFLDYNNCTMYLLQGSNRTDPSVVDLVNDSGNGDNIALYGLGSNFWFRENRPSYTWRPILSSNRLSYVEDEYKGKQNGMALFYDPKYSDVYAIPGLDNLNTYRDALCNSEELRAFTSFMSYGGATMFSHEAKMFAFAYQRNAVYYEDTGYEQEIESDTASLKLYELWSDSEKTYNNIFGVIEPFSFTFVCNEYPTFTKVFDNIDIRMDQYDYNEETGQTELVGGTYSVAHQAGQPFNYIQVKNEYQDTGVKAFNPMALRKKFRVWRAQIPRNGNGRDRIRNTWAMITLGNDDPGTALSIVHDINVNFSI